MHFLLLTGLAALFWSQPLHALPQLFSLGYVGPTVPAPVTPASQCTTNGVHILTMRGQGNPIVNGTIQQLVTAIQAQIPGSDFVAVPYPATNGIPPPPYALAVDQGAADVTAFVAQYARDCPRSKIVIAGYSEGAQATMSAVCGESSFGYTASAPMSTQYLSNILAIVSIADPSQVANMAWNHGTGASYNGVFARSKPQQCAPYASKIAAYCLQYDTFCAPVMGLSDLVIHIAEVDVWRDQATAFVVQQYNKMVGY